MARHAECVITPASDPAKSSFARSARLYVARPKGLRPRSTTGRPAGAVADALLRRDAATYYRLTRGSRIPVDVGGSQSPPAKPLMMNLGNGSRR